MVFLKARALSACVISLALVRPALADDVLTLSAALDAALKRNPELAASAFSLNAVQARRLQALLRPNPEVSLEFENFAGNGSMRDTETLETTLALSQVIELGGKRAARVAVAESDSELAEIDRQSHQIDVLAETTLRFIDAAASQERLTLADEAARLAEESLAAISRRVEAARSPLAERSRARIALTRASIELKQAESQARAARYLLAASFGDAEPQFLGVRGDLFAFGPSEPFNRWFARLERNPALLRFASVARLRDAELRLAQAQSRPNLALSLGLRRFEGTGDTALVASVSLPIAWSDRNQGAIAEARVKSSQSESERVATLNRARATLFALHQEMESARIRAVSLRDEALPLAREALAQTQAGHERGRFSFLELATAQSESLELQQAAIDAAADHHRLRAELERLTAESTP